MKIIARSSNFIVFLISANLAPVTTFDPIWAHSCAPIDHFWVSMGVLRTTLGAQGSPQDANVSGLCGIVLELCANESRLWVPRLPWDLKRC